MHKNIPGLLSLLFAAVAIASLLYGLTTAGPEHKKLSNRYESVDREAEFYRGPGRMGPNPILQEYDQRLSRISDERSEAMFKLETATFGGIALGLLALVLSLVGLSKRPRGIAIGGMVGALGAAGLVAIVIGTNPAAF
ncbi:MAG: hypothetical protein AAF799_32540 [Myxococcota bacterium]